jgi:hypothetical protein
MSQCDDSISLSISGEVVILHPVVLRRLRGWRAGSLEKRRESSGQTQAQLFNKLDPFSEHKINVRDDETVIRRSMPVLKMYRKLECFLHMRNFTFLLFYRVLCRHYQLLP